MCWGGGFSVICNDGRQGRQAGREGGWRGLVVMWCGSIIWVIAVQLPPSQHWARPSHDWFFVSPAAHTGGGGAVDTSQHVIWYLPRMDMLTTLQPTLSSLCMLCVPIVPNVPTPTILKNDQMYCWTLERLKEHILNNYSNWTFNLAF